MTSDLREQFPYRSLLAVCAHPDDEAFGLGAVISTLRDAGVATSLLCFTHGEASTLGASTDDLARRRADELTAAADVLGLGSVSLHSYRDGHLTEVPVENLCARLDSFIDAGEFDCLLAFDEGGITGHPDHQQATTAARTVAQRRRLPLLAWTLTRTVTDALNEEFRAGFVGRNLSEIDVTLDVDRTMQHDAIACHASQSADNPVLRRRLSLQGNTEVLVWLDRPDTRPGHPPGRDHSDGT
jgi:LmbE family N-acetylglucosaminyl deacetylase